MGRVVGIFSRTIKGGLRRAAHRKLIHIRFPDDHRTCFLQIHHRFRRVNRFKIRQNSGAASRKLPFDTQIIFHRNRHSGQRPCKITGLNLFLYLCRLSHRPLFIQCYITVNLQLCSFCTFKRCSGSLFCSKFSFFYHFPQLKSCKA